jgi:hypothetical protein
MPFMNRQLLRILTGITLAAALFVAFAFSDAPTTNAGINGTSEPPPAQFSDISGSANCSQAQVTFEANDYYGYWVYVELHIDGVFVESDDFEIDYEGPESVLFNYGPLTTNSSILIQGYIYYGGKSGRVPTKGLGKVAAFGGIGMETLLFELVNCGGDEEPVVTPEPDDGRFCFAPGEARAAVYTFADSVGGVGLTIWAIDASNRGEPVITIDSAQLRALPDRPRVNTLISQSLFNNVKFYKLTNGKFQINVGPAGEPKIHICVFDGIPATEQNVFTFEYGR